MSPPRTPRTSRLALVLIASALLPPAARAAPPAQPAFVPLFDGRTLAGWSARGSNRFSVTGGAVVALGGPIDAPSLLCTDRPFGDFVLEYELQAGAALGAGVLVRAAAGANATPGVAPTLPSGLVRPTGWTAVRIEASGDTLAVAVAGRAVSPIEGTPALDGAVCLTAPAQAEGRASWRKLRIQDRGRHAWMPLLSGTDMRGFMPTGAGDWTLEGGVVVGKIGANDRTPSVLYAQGPVSDYTARLEYRLRGGNAGLYLRAAPGANPGYAVGVQVDLDAREGSGGLYDNGGRGWLIGNVPIGGADAWHRLVVTVRGRHVAVFLDGARTSLAEDAPGAATGQLALELAAGAAATFEVRRFDLMSPAIRPPVPGLPVGRCVRVVGIEAPEEAKAAGFEYLELALHDLLPLDDAAFGREVARIRGLGLPALSGYGFLPADLKIVGPDVDAAKVDAALEHGLGRAAALGLSMVVYGNGDARKAPAGFAADKAWAQLVDFGGRAARAAQKHKLIVLFEPMPARQTNTVNTVAEALKLVGAVNHPAFQLLIDFTYVTEQKEDLATIQQAARAIRQVEIANPNGRIYPRSPDEADYAPFFRALVRGGYRGGFSVHGKPNIFYADAPRALATLRQLAAEALTPPRRLPQ